MSLTLAWEVGLLEPDFFIPDSPLKSDVFILEYLGKSKWTLQLLRTIVDEQDTLSVCLANESSPDCCAVNLELTIDVYSDEDGEESLCIGETHTFSPGNVRLYIYMQSEELDESRRNVKVTCTIIKYSISIPGMSDPESVSKDMEKLMESSLFSDLTVFTRDDGEFKVHKFVLCSRWKEIKSKISATESTLRLPSVPRWIFEIFLKYLYTGKVENWQDSADLYDFMSRSCWELKCAMRSLPSAFVSRSRLDTERKIFTWDVDDTTTNLLPLIRMVPLYNTYTQVMTIALDTTYSQALAPDPVVVVSLSFPNCKAERPILVRGYLFLEAGSNVQIRQEFSNVVHNEFEMRKQLLISERSLYSFPSYRLTVTLDIGDGYSQSVLESCRTYFTSVTPDVYDVQSLTNDLRIAQQKYIYSDLRLDTQRKSLVLVHKALLAIRSERFKMFLINYEFPNDRVWKLDLTSVPIEIMMHIITYIYTGSVGSMSNQKMASVNRLAQLFRLHKLHAYCETNLGLH